MLSVVLQSVNQPSKKIEERWLGRPQYPPQLLTRKRLECILYDRVRIVERKGRKEKAITELCPARRRMAAQTEKKISPLKPSGYFVYRQA